MQSEPHATPENISNTSTPSEASNSSQHGLPLEQQLHSADQRGRTQEERVERPAGVRYGAISPGSSSGDDIGLPEQLGRLNVGDRIDNRPKASFQRIADYENASSPSPPKQLSEGPVFKIIKRKGHSIDGPQLQEFPNGMPYSI